MTQTVLITGANRGIGLEFCQQYLANDWHVIGCCRNPAQATELQTLAEKHDKLTIAQVDIADDEQVQALVSQLSGASLDLIINNAGIYGSKSASLADITAEQWLHVLHIDTVAPVLFTQALKPTLKPSSKVAFISSKMGSIADNQSGGSYMYRSAKAALNAAVKSLANDWAEKNCTVLAMHPGWVKTDMGGPNALITTAQSVAGLRSVIEQASSDDSGQFINYDGAIIPW